MLYKLKELLSGDHFVGDSISFITLIQLNQIIIFITAESASVSKLLYEWQQWHCILGPV